MFQHVLKTNYITWDKQEEDIVQGKQGGLAANAAESKSNVVLEKARLTSIDPVQFKSGVSGKDFNNGRTQS